MVDTTLTLYDIDCTSVLTYHDDNSLTDLFSTITWPFTATGLYYAKVEHFFDEGECGPRYEYYLEMEIITNSLSSPRPEGVAHLPPRPPMLWERTGIFLPVYRKEWDSLERFRH